MRLASLAPVVILSALAIAPAPRIHAAPGPKRIYSRGQTTWIYAEPKRTKNALGYIRMGQSLPLRDTAPAKGPGCAGEYHPVEPYGWVCLDRTATLSGEGRWLRAMATLSPKKTLMPFDYALSNGAPMYRRLPTPSEVQRETATFGKARTYRPQSWGNRGHEKLAEVRDVAASPSVPWFFESGGGAGEERPLEALRRQIPHGSMLAFAGAFQHEGRTYLASADGTLVPRSHANALLDDPTEAAAQVRQLIRERGIVSVCVHGDSPGAVAFTAALRQLLWAKA